MKLEIERLQSGYTLSILINDGKTERHAYHGVYGLLLAVIEALSGEDQIAQYIGLKRKSDIRYKNIKEVLKKSGKALTINEIAIKTAEQMAESWSPRLQKAVGVALANATMPAKRDTSLVERVGPGMYRYRSTEDSPRRRKICSQKQRRRCGKGTEMG